MLTIWNSLDTFDTDLLGFFDTKLWKPLSDIDENDKEFFIELDIPGVNINDINISTDRNVLIVEGERKYKKLGYKTERYYGKFKRKFTLPSAIDYDNIDAILKNGVLKITIPKNCNNVLKSINIKCE